MQVQQFIIPEVANVYRLRFALSIGLCAVASVFVGGQQAKQDAAAQKFELKLEKGKSFYQQMTTSVTQGIKVMGSDLTQSQDSTFSFKWTPVKSEGEKWELTDEIEGVKMSIDISGNKITFDSNQSDGSPTAGNPQLMDFFKKIVGSKFNVTLDKNMKVEKVEGVQEFLKALGSGNPQMDGVLKSIMTDEAVKQICDPTFGLLPDSAKKPGEAWDTKPITVSVGPIGSYTVSYKYTFVGIEKDLCKIEVVPNVIYNAPNAATGGGGGLLFRIKEGKLTSEAPPSKSVIMYNPKLGRIDSADITIKLKGDLMVTIGNAETKVELIMTQTTKFVTQDTSFVKK